MKSHITIAIAIFQLCFISSSAQTSFSLPISSVEIHQEGARIVHSGPVQLKTTVCTIEISDLSHDLDFNSISIDLPLGSSLEAINFDVQNRISSHTNELSVVLESLSKLDVKTRMLEAVLHTYKEEQLFLSANRSIGSSQEVLLVDDVIEMADFLRERNQSLALDILDVSLDIESLELESAELEARKTALKLVGSDLEGVLTLDIKNSIIYRSDQNLTLKYLTPSAHWAPEYEVNFSTDGILVKRYASVVQTSGLDWLSAPLTLISGRPSGSLAPSPFEDWILTTTATRRIIASPSFDDYTQVFSAKTTSQSYADFPQTSSYVGKARYRFEFEATSIIASDGNPTRVEIDEFTLEGDLRYFATPALNSEAYTTVRIADWSGNKLMDGKAQIISDNTFLGSFPLQLPVIGDTLVMSLGSNPHVLCSRELSEEFSKSTFLSRKSITSTWILTVENTLADSIYVDLVDALPQSSTRDGDIEIEVSASDLGEIDLINHLVTYSLELAPGERREVSLTINVTYPRRSILRGF
ncbi:MAG: DUF4139 domain-containing protein [Flavobacteriales bacterium]|nr:DUF4139 domain-containing protein [Flavobacteriales bacterium]